MEHKIIAKGILRALFITIGVGLLVWFFLAIKMVIVYLLLAGIFTLMGKPLVSWLHLKLKFHKTVAAVFTLFIFLVLLSSLFYLLIPLFIEQGKNLSFLNEDYFKQNTSILIQETNSFLKDKGIDLEDYLSDINLFSVFNFDSFKTILNSVINIFSQITIGIFSTLFITFFLLKENNILTQLVRNIINEKHQQNALNSAIAIKRMLSRYFIGLLIQIGILFLFYWITLSILGIPNASVIALLCALLNLIPYVGPLIGIFLMLTLSLIGIIGLDFDTVLVPTGLYIMIWYGIAQLIDNFISQPLIYSKSSKSHPLEIFIVILIFGFTTGILGMIIAVPLYTSIKIIAKEFFTDNKIVKYLTKSF